MARELDILTVAVVTRPFSFERRTDIAEKGIQELERHVDSLIVIPNDKLPSVLGEKTLVVDAFAAANDVLLGAVQGISDLIIAARTDEHGLRGCAHGHVRNGQGDDGHRPGDGRESCPGRGGELRFAVRCSKTSNSRERGERSSTWWRAPILNLGEVYEVGDAVEEFISQGVQGGPRHGD